MTNSVINPPAPSARDASATAFFAAIVVGLLVRLAILAFTGGLGTTIIDEQHYTRIALNILAGHGFAWNAGELTSIRPPLYPAFLAGLWSLTGGEQLQLVRAVQIVVSLATAALVYALGLRLFDRRVARIAAAVCWLYPSFVFFDFLILTETLFTFFLVAFVLLCVMLVQTPRASTALLCGAALACAALTRSVLWPLPLVLCPLLLLLVRAPFGRRVVLSACVLLAYVVVVGPWAVRNTRLQKTVTVVDTMGGMNLRMGNYEYTPDDRMWDAVALKGDKSWIAGLDREWTGPRPITEGQKEKWAQRKAIEYMRQHPVETLRRSLIKFADLWGLEREFIAGVQQGFFAPPVWFQIAATLLIVVAYVAVLVTGVAGLWIAAPRDWRAQLLLVLPVLVIVAAHTIVFGHSRYHLPLMPIFGLYAGAFVVSPFAAARWPSRATLAGAAATVVVLVAIWVRQVAIVDLPRLAALVHHAS